GDVLICPQESPEELIEIMESALGIKAVKAFIGNTSLHGSLIAGNSKGAVIPYFFDPQDIKQVMEKSGQAPDEEFNIFTSLDPLTAWGNNLLLSEKVAMYNPEMEKRSVKRISSELDIEMVPGTIAGINTVGSIAMLNSKGIVVHPKASEDDLDRIQEIFSLKPEISTINFGSPYLGSSMVANDNGAVIGNSSSGVEINRIEDALDLIV
ncbi:MAG: translation initiation factor IF-6, partial [Thermoplasmata archaeon]|nr:translation initiation factor IF-6 [Thermoplasmata archaeon]